MQETRKAAAEQLSSSRPSAKKGGRHLVDHGCMLNAPFFHILLSPILPITRALWGRIFALRWHLSRPLQIHVTPKWIPFIDLPLLRSLPSLTLGQILLALPLVILIVASYYRAVATSDTAQAGEFTSYAIYATFLTASKTNSIVTLLFGIPFERLVPFHNLSALTAVVLACFHVYIAFVTGVPADGRRLEDSEYVLHGPDPNFFRFLFDGTTPNRTGSLMFLSILSMVITSIFPLFRRKFFDIWFWTHMALAVCVIIFAILHSVTLILMVAAWWAVDIVIRVVVMASCRYPTTAKLRRIGNDIVEISFQKPDSFQYNAGQFVQIALPDINILAFHPFSIASAPYESTVTMYVRALGGWTQKLLELAEKKDQVSLMMEGPYGSLSMDANNGNRYQMALCVCGGIGVTHCQSIAKALLKDHEKGRPLKHLRFVWAVRDLSILEVMPPLENLIDIELAQHNIDTTESLEVSLDAMSTEDRCDASPTLVDTHVFVTNTAKGYAKSGALQMDPRHIHFGRPNLEAIVQDLKVEAKQQGVTHVAVFGCGPKVMLDRLQEVCREKSSGVFECDGVTFEVHEEIFEL